MSYTEEELMAIDMERLREVMRVRERDRDNQYRQREEAFRQMQTQHQVDALQYQSSLTTFNRDEMSKLLERIEESKMKEECKTKNNFDDDLFEI
jgi:hypothetical protein